MGLGDMEEESDDLGGMGLGDMDEESDDEFGVSASDELDGFGGLDEDADDEFGLSVSEESEDIVVASADPLGEEDDEFVPESIPDPFGEATSDDLDMDLGGLDEDDDDFWGLVLIR